MVTADGSEEYDFVIVPEVTGVSTNVAGTLGTHLKIDGTGFGDDHTTISVSAGGLDCAVDSLVNGQISC